MKRRVADRVELHLTRQHAVFVATDLDIDQADEEAGLAELPIEKRPFDIDHHRVELVAVDHARDHSVATRGARRALADAFAGRGCDGVDLGHVVCLPAPDPPLAPARRRRSSRVPVVSWSAGFYPPDGV